MNPPPKPMKEAMLRFGTPDFEFIKAGDHVRCAVSGAAIPLEALNYWSVELQEAYASGELMTQRWRETR
ncbi:MAG: DUF2093 domain-containing protein [Brevundimonas sp.]|uniref:DUF2093 domain-containing protein n=1 Tax=Brevundimonas sp. TaxID=1871086 RepID=UPI001203C44E|nr:DUF2093 domain-containing protein [Brevundimonas sp.]RZJ17593.1 MAG: DUF2093 domain-containing protein [Brevundimonas sp.]